MLTRRRAGHSALLHKVMSIVVLQSSRGAGLLLLDGFRPGLLAKDSAEDRK